MQEEPKNMAQESIEASNKKPEPAAVLNLKNFPNQKSGRLLSASELYEIAK